MFSNFFSIQNQTKTLLFLAGFIILLILSICINTFYWADDYALLNNLNKIGILQHSIEGYLTWDGRMLTLSAFVQCFFLKNLPIQLITFLWSLCFFTSGIMIFYIINQELQLKIINKYQKSLIILLLAIVSWLGAFIHFSETIYWGTGGCYSFGLMLGSIWVFGFLKIQKVKISFFLKIIFLIFSIIVGGTTQNLTLALFTLIIIYLVNNHLKNLKSVNNINFLILISILFGLSFIMLAPGNALRMGHSGYATFSNLTFFIFLKNCLFVLFYYFVYSLIAIFLSALLTYGIFNLLNPKIKFNKFPKTIFPKSKENWVDFFFEFKWFLVALSTVLPFILMPNLMARRTVIFFTYFMIVFVITFCIKIFQKSFLINDEVVDTNRISKTSISFSIILIGALIFTIYYLEKGFILKKVIAERENLLNISRGKTVYLKLINQELTSPCYHFSDFYINIPEQDNFIKSSQEEYFGVKIVIEK